ncbi:MAG: B12-binding domain-containing radical SAM protein [Verrucomicrobia bacterium]|nr:B12-binding domain-containing radical SAM protein [Verrucomicrobiota bacterium]
MGNKQKLTLIQPPLSDEKYPGVPFRFEPISLLTVAALTRRDWFDVRIIDGSEERDLSKLVDPRADLVGITVVDATAAAAYRLAAIYRERGIPVILGGPHITLYPEDAAGKANSLVIGEIENGWEEVLSDFLNGRLKDNYQFAPPDRINSTVDRDILPDYRKTYRFISAIQATRGCPNNCSFCVPAACYGQNVRHRPVDSVVAEIKTLKEKYGRRWIGFTDDNLTADREYAKQLFKALIPLRIRWASQVCIDIAKDFELLDLAAESGCVALFMGLESPRQEALREAGKPFMCSEYPALLGNIRDRNIAIIASFTIGYDTDDEQVYDDIVTFCGRHAIEFPLFVALMAYKGVPLYDNLKKAGRTIYENEAIHPLITNFQPLQLDRNKMAARIAKMYGDYYNACYVMEHLWKSISRFSFARFVQFLGIFVFYLRFAGAMRRGSFLQAPRSAKQE